MIGELVPVVFLPRFTSYVGAGSFVTAPMDVEEFDMAFFAFWRGPLVCGAASDAFEAFFEESQDAQFWTPAASSSAQPITTTDTTTDCWVEFTKRWFRVRVELAADANGVVGVSLWMAGGLRRYTA